MSVAQLPSGRWRARVWKADVGKEVAVNHVLGLPVTTSFATEEEARRHAQMASDLMASPFFKGLRIVPAPPVDPRFHLGRRFRLEVKGETVCRECGAEAHHLHHILPKLDFPEGANNWEENGLPLCRRCHHGWHCHTVELPHTILTDGEFAFACRMRGVAWVGRHYFDETVSAEDRLAKLPKRLQARILKSIAERESSSPRSPSGSEGES